jgi:CRISPR/Cas system CSM-associated protein Csm3 (group 7 of RAMP superfamily)
MSIHALTFEVVFPHGLCDGQGSGYNRIEMTRDGQGRPVIHGSSIAGVLRHGLPQDEYVDFFGKPAKEQAGDQPGYDSPLQVPDCVLSFSKDNSSEVERTHHLRDRHTKAVQKGGLYSLETCPPGTKMMLTLWLDDSAIAMLLGSSEQAIESSKAFLSSVHELFRQGITMGGSAARGIGLAETSNSYQYRFYDTCQLEDHAAYLDDHRKWRGAPNVFPTGREQLPKPKLVDDRLRLRLRLEIPRGQDLLVGDGRGTNFTLEPQIVRGANGKRLWRLPGSSLRGAWKTWMTRLAAMEQNDGDYRIADSWDHGPDANGEKLGFALAVNQDALGDNEDYGDRNINCPITSLFGSCFKKRRIDIFDSLSECRVVDADKLPYRSQSRMHVAVDRITGGAAESMLFDNAVLTSEDVDFFDVLIWVRTPELREIEWLKKALQAMHHGLIRIGSSKSSGRLSIRELKILSDPTTDSAKETSSIELNAMTPW